MPIIRRDRKYLKNKHRGGKNNKKGSQYENFYAVYCLAMLMNEYQQQLEAVCLTSQVEDAFVDDLLIEKPVSEKIYHQLKDVKTLTWKDNGLLYDFTKQMEISQEKGECFHLNLIYSNADSSVKEIPEDISSCTNAIYFPAYSSLNQLLLSYSPFKDAILHMAVDGEKAENDKLFGIAGALLGAWDSCGQIKVSLAEISAKMQSIGKGYVNVKGYPTVKISDNSRMIMDRCGLHFHIDGIKLYWSNGNGRLKGEIEWTPDLEKRLLEEAPTDLFGIVELLS